MTHMGSLWPITSCIFHACAVVRTTHEFVQSQPKQCGASPSRRDVFTPRCASWRSWKAELPPSSAGCSGSSETRTSKRPTPNTSGAEAPSSCCRSMTSFASCGPDTAWWTAELHLEPGARWQCRGSTRPVQVRRSTDTDRQWLINGACKRLSRMCHSRYDWSLAAVRVTVGGLTLIPDNWCLIQTDTRQPLRYVHLASTRMDSLLPSKLP